LDLLGVSSFSLGRQGRWTSEESPVFKPVLFKTTFVVLSTIGLITSSLPSSVAQTLGPNTTATFVVRMIVFQSAM
jgi:hypothetical protein